MKHFSLSSVDREMQEKMAGAAMSMGTESLGEAGSPTKHLSLKLHHNAISTPASLSEN
jgi:hypothetical protein